MLRFQKDLLSPWQGLPTRVCWDTAEAAAQSLLRPPPGSWQQRSTIFWWRQDKKCQRTPGAGEIPHGDTTVLCPAPRVPNIPGGGSAQAVGLPELGRGLENLLLGTPRQQGACWYNAKWQHSFYPKLAHAICHSSVGHLSIGGVMTWAGGFSS